MLSFQFILDRNSGVPLYKQLANQLVKTITSGRFPEGAKLPAQRELAKILNVSRSVVSLAYEELNSLGIIITRTGSGSYAISINKRSRAISGKRDWCNEVEIWSRNIKILNYYKYHWNRKIQNLISFDWCFARTSDLPAETIKRIIEETSEEEIAEFLVAREIRGSNELLNSLLVRLKSIGENITEGNIFISSGFLESVFMLFLVLTRPGDKVIFESPTCLKVIKLAKFFGLQVLGIPRTKEGINLNTLEEYLQKEDVKFILTMTRSNNPMGSNVPETKKELLARIAAEYNVPIVDIAVGSIIQYEGNNPRPLKYYDFNDMVIEIYDLALCVAPGVDTGWIVAPSDIVDRLFCTTYALNMDGTGLNELVAYKMFSSNLFDQQIETYTKLFTRKREIMIHACSRFMPSYVRLNIPDGGIFFWLEMPTGFNSWKILDEAFKRKIIFLPGTECFVNGNGETFMRLSFIGIDDEKIPYGIKLLSGIVEDYRVNALGKMHDFIYDNGI